MIISEIKQKHTSYIVKTTCVTLHPLEVKGLSHQCHPQESQNGIPNQDERMVPLIQGALEVERMHLKGEYWYSSCLAVVMKYKMLIHFHNEFSRKNDHRIIQYCYLMHFIMFESCDAWNILKLSFSKNIKYPKKFLTWFISATVREMENEVHISKKLLCSYMLINEKFFQ